MLADKGAKAVIKFVRGIADAIDNNSSEMGKAGGELATAMIRGMASGLTGGIGAIKDAAVGVAKSALNSAKSFLGIKSPSKEFMKIGRYVDEGFAYGISAYSAIVDQEIEAVGASALNAMANTMAQLSDDMNADMTLTPVISPVLDLAQVQKDAAKINSMITTNPLTAGVSFDQASGISEQQQQTSVAQESTIAAQAAQINFQQNNYSPEALSAVDIYRSTKNQLSLAKEALNI